MSIQPNLVWLDSDVLIKKWVDFPLKEGRPYMNDRTGSIIFVNGCNKFFESLYERYLNDESLNYPGWFQLLLKEHESEIDILPEGYFVHCCLSQAIKAGNGFNNYGTQDFSIHKDENGALKLKVNF